jgi:hypothetical protein
MSDFLYRLPIRTPPLLGESLRSYLIRSATMNGLAGINGLTTSVVGRPIATFTPRLAIKLADYCRCDVPEFFQLSGIEYRDINGACLWQIGGHSITKGHFIRSTHQPLCPLCLQESPYLRNSWEVSLYTACSHHQSWLLDKCPQCSRRITIIRTVVDRCNCGFPFGEAIPERADASNLLVSTLIDAHLQDGQSVLANRPWPLELTMVEHLSAMPLDTFLKVLWFFGHCLPGKANGGVGRGRGRPGISSSMKLIQGAISTLTAWPNRFRKLLENSAASLDYPSSHLWRANNYIEEEFRGLDCVIFICAAYDLFIAPMRRKSTGDYEVCGHYHQLKLF